ncbi:hypothetical protein M413DRAFT_19748 [Hebeloma cylindrosporum]|uniref:Yeast cell wall synthesis Kre9/Knh1-like N-terminal domain-containing protein n=1 Tax=Hebeloma cylindrosporum TaxID=76867 RepID=A0A0C3BSI2_HEBCY|nr:hypothetical protein M413DRAFT_19748 [Hebeloma cylindrosporum h7]
MFAAHAFAALLALATPFFALADVTPSEPGPGDSFNAGATCRTTWLADPDSTTVWKNMAIQLMSGSNLGMVHITTIATGQDGTVDGKFEYPCPEVNPNSAIYFYQFSSPQTSVKTWTTRFTIASASGATTPPANPTQPGSNDAIPWGVGNLVDPSKAVAAPPSGGAPAGNSSSPGSIPASSSSPSSLLPTSTPSKMATNIVTSSTDSASATSTSKAAANGASALGLDSRVGLSVAALAFAALLW